MNRTSIHFIGGGRIYVREDYAEVKRRLTGRTRGNVEFTRGNDREYRHCSVNVAAVTVYESTDNVAA